MKYQSELIKEIVDTRGHKKSSLHYESECIETWIEEAKGAYPKLCDYESEWIKYISILDDTGGSEDPEPPIGEFPYVVLSDVTEATIDNVVPYAYKSAILKGNTLESLTYGVHLPLTKNSIDFQLKGMKSGKKYTIFYDVEATSSTNLPKVGIIGKAGVNSGANWLIYQNSIPLGTGKIVFTMPSFYSISFLRIHKNDSLNEPITLNNLMLLEGDYTNINIPFFDGIQSVRMPVLTTSNEDDTKSIILTVNEPVELRGIGDVKDELDLLTGELTQRVREIVLDGSEDWKAEDHRFTLEGVGNLLEGKWNLLISDKYSSYTFLNSITQYDSYILGNGWSQSFHIRDVALFPNPKNQLNEFKEYLSQNPVTLQYQTATESIRTVDLNIQDQNGKTLSLIKPIEGKMFLSTSSDTIKPLFSGEIPVEAITQNLASFIDLD